MRSITTLTIAALFGLTACGEAEVDQAGDVPEAAEIEGLNAEADPGDRLELDRESDLGVDDVGESIMATGRVAGVPLSDGFFLRTVDDQLIFVEGNQSARAGETVRVIGTLEATEALVFEGWETDAFATGFEAEWDVETVVYIDASSVMPMNGETRRGGTAEESQLRNGAGAQDSPSTDREEQDPGSKSG